MIKKTLLTLKRLPKLIVAHKFISGIIIAIIVVGGYFGYKALNKSGDAIKYAIASVEKGTLIVSISGSGQVSAKNQVDVKSKVSGDVVFVGVKNGQEVKAGTLLAQISSQDAQKSVRDAEIAFQREKLNLEKMEGMTTDDGTIRGIRKKAEDDIEKAYEDGFNMVANIFLELPEIMAGIDDMLFSHDFETNRQNINYYVDAVRNYDETKVSLYEKDTYDKYQAARVAYDKNFQDYKSTSRFSQAETISVLIDQTYETVKSAAEAIKSANNLIQFYHDELTRRGFRIQSLSDTHLSSLNSYTGKTNNYLLNLLSIKNTIRSSVESIVETNFDIADQKIQVEQAEESLLDAKEKLADYYIRAPFNGIVTNIGVEKGDTIGSSTLISTLITKQQIAEISLNEVDVAQVKIGQKVTLTFDAIEDLTISGEVLEVDTLGTVSQGVVSYNVKIGFDTQDERVKPGMTVSASIIIDAKQNVLLVPSSAVKVNNGTSYVEVVSGTTDSSSFANVSGLSSLQFLSTQTVEVGASNDTMTEVLSGVNEGDVVVTQTINSTSVSTGSTQQNSGFRVPGVGGGAFRD
ncbi:MAG: efflux RND transporter periplasmic adaptor subunit [bacterium]|nr:efflux RND transporter periplasmic adaptor subunit [bacterium]